MWQIFKKEIGQYFNSTVAYLINIIFMLTMGLMLWVFPDSNLMDYGFADMGSFFDLVPYLFMFLIPAITMRSFAEEKKTGTIELLLTKPINDLQLVLGKYFGAVFLIVLLILPTLIYYYSLVQYGNPIGNVDSAAVFGSYAGLILLGAVFAAFGIFSSVINENQISAFLIALFICFFTYEGISALAYLDIWSDWSARIEELSLQYHYRFLGKGLIDSRNVIFMVSVAAAFLLFSRLILNSRKW